MNINRAAGPGVWTREQQKIFFPTFRDKERGTQSLQLAGCLYRCNPDFPRFNVPSKKIPLDPDYPLGIKKSYISEVYDVSLDSSHQGESEYV